MCWVTSHLFWSIQMVMKKMSIVHCDTIVHFLEGSTIGVNQRENLKTLLKLLKSDKELCNGNWSFSLMSPYWPCVSDGSIRARREAAELITHNALYLLYKPIRGVLWSDVAGLSSATSCVQKMRSSDFMNILKDQVIPLMDFLFPDGIGVFQQNKDSSG